MSCVLALLTLCAQDDLKSRVDALVEKLSDASLEAREEAARELKALHRHERVLLWLDSVGTAEARAVADWIRVRRVAPDGLIAQHPKLVEDWLAADTDARVDLLERVFQRAFIIKDDGTIPDERKEPGRHDARTFLSAMITAEFAARCDETRQAKLLTIVLLADMPKNPVPPALLGSSSLEVATSAARALVWNSRDLDRIQSDPRPDVRLVLAGECPNLDRHARRIAGLLSDRDGRVRAAASRWLAVGNHQAHTAAVARLLSDVDRGAREQAIRSIGYLRAAAHADAVAAQLASNDVLMQHAALWALGRLGAKAHAAKVVPFLDGEWQHHAVEAVRALGSMDDREHEPDLRKLLTRESEVARVAATVLARWGDRDAAALLVDQFRHLELDERRDASLALSAFRDPDAWRDFLGASGRAGALTGFARVDAAFAAEIEKRAGIKIAFEEPGSIDTWGDVRLVDALLTVASGVPIVERGRVRIVSQDAAVAFWRDWWKEKK
jgi:HEAT repeat protein